MIEPTEEWSNFASTSDCMRNRFRTGLQLGGGEAKERARGALRVGKGATDDGAVLSQARLIGARKSSY